MTEERGPFSETAYAKINLALHVRERLPDGYHRVETLFAFCEDGDVLAAEEGDGLGLAIEGPFAEALSAGPGNLVMQAAERLRDTLAPGRGAAMTLTKNLPVASGIGGGSADAAAALRLLARLWDIPADADELREIAAGLGADVPACLLSETCRGEGRGDILVRMEGEGLAGMPVLLVNPGVEVPTGKVFAAWDGEDRGPLALAGSVRPRPEWRNDLAGPATSIASEIGEVLAALEACPGTSFVRMSGSGATCFALFGTVEERDSSAGIVAKTHPGWWMVASALR